MANGDQKFTEIFDEATGEKSAQKKLSFIDIFEQSIAPPPPGSKGALEPPPIDTAPKPPRIPFTTKAAGAVAGAASQIAATGRKLKEKVTGDERLAEEFEKQASPEMLLVLAGVPQDMRIKIAAKIQRANKEGRIEEIKEQTSSIQEKIDRVLVENEPFPDPEPQTRRFPGRRDPRNTIARSAERQKGVVAQNFLRRLQKLDPNDVGFISGITRKGSEPERLLPIIGSIVEATELASVLDAVVKEDRGDELTEGESALLDSFAALMAAEEAFEPGVLDNAGQILVEIPGFALEFGATAGLFPVGKKAAGRLITKVLGRRVRKMLVGRGAAKNWSARSIRDGFFPFLSSSLLSKNSSASSVRLSFPARLPSERTRSAGSVA